MVLVALMLATVKMPALSSSLAPTASGPISPCPIELAINLLVPGPRVPSSVPLAIILPVIVGMREVESVPVVIFEASRLGICAASKVPLVIIDAARLGI
jgi:hypothetical protein